MSSVHITIFTVIVAVFFGTVLALGLHGLRKKEPFLRIFGIRVVLFLYLLCMLRMALPVEFSLAVPVGVTVLDGLVNILHMPCLNPQWKECGKAAGVDLDGRNSSFSGCLFSVGDLYLLSTAKARGDSARIRGTDSGNGEGPSAPQAGCSGSRV